MKKTGGVSERGVKSGAKFIIRQGVKLIATFPSPRGLLNGVYVKLTPSQRSLFQRGFARIFRNGYSCRGNGNWKVIFANKTIVLPLTSERCWLDWDTAVSVVGHDIEVKETYEALIRSSEAPELFIDIGANYGTHSLLFLVHQIITITFEPNTSCHDYFREICTLNQVKPTLEPVALGEKRCQVELLYPKRDTWLGTTNTGGKARAFDPGLVSEKVDQKTLDDYFPQIKHKRTLIKIDTEGNELSVLLGAITVLRETKPRIIFECRDERERIDLWDFFHSENYIICGLPWRPVGKPQPLTRQQLMATSKINFIAVPI
jgi:FkbM family methyltransferase